MFTRNKIIVLLKNSVISILAIIVGAVIFNSISPQGIPLITPSRTIMIHDKSVKIPVFQTRQIVRSYAENSDFHVPDNIDIASAFKHYQNNTAIFIDTRERAEYLKGHISKAVSVPPGYEDAGSDILHGLSKNERIITYCDGEDCSLSIELAMFLSETGFMDVWFFFNGWNEWQSAGYPITVGDHP